MLASGTKLHRKSDQMSGRTDCGKRKGWKHQDRRSSGQVDGERERVERGGAAGSIRGWGLAPGIEGACRDLLADQQ